MGFLEIEANGRGNLVKNVGDEVRMKEEMDRIQKFMKGIGKINLDRKQDDSMLQEKPKL